MYAEQPMLIDDSTEERFAQNHLGSSYGKWASSSFFFGYVAYVSSVNCDHVSIFIVILFTRKEGCNQRVTRPVEKPRRQAVVLR